jgi:L-aspartate oxidase
VIERAPHAIDRLVELGVPFNARGDEHLHLTREGGHSHRRIVHVDDATGWAVQAALVKAAEAHPNITLLPGQTCIDLITGKHEERYSGSGRVWGVYALDEARPAKSRRTPRAPPFWRPAERAASISSAPPRAARPATASRWPGARAAVSNMEMMQFHPTCLYNLDVKNFLITEAVRGEGGHLLNPRTGHRYMPDYDERAELAPRDIVARANRQRDQARRARLRPPRYQPPAAPNS